MRPLPHLIMRPGGGTEVGCPNPLRRSPADHDRPYSFRHRSGRHIRAKRASLPHLWPSPIPVLQNVNLTIEKSRSANASQGCRRLDSGVLCRAISVRSVLSPGSDQLLRRRKAAIFWSAMHCHWVFPSRIMQAQHAYLNGCV